MQKKPWKLFFSAVSSTQKSAEKKKESQSKPEPKPKPKTKRKSEQQVPFNRIMEGVVFVLSGFQNPFRGELREKALEMGAKYRPDWTPDSTHLMWVDHPQDIHKSADYTGSIKKLRFITHINFQFMAYSWLEPIFFLLKNKMLNGAVR